jgi:hypothetical protein
MPPAIIPLPGLPPAPQRAQPLAVAPPAVADGIAAPLAANYIPGAPAIATSTTVWADPVAAVPAPAPAPVAAPVAPVAPVVPLAGPQKTVIPVPALPTVATQQVPLTRSRPDITKPPIRREQVPALDVPPISATPLVPVLPAAGTEIPHPSESSLAKSRDATVMDERAQTVATLQPVESFILQRSDTPVDDRKTTDPVPPTSDTSLIN